MHRSLAGVAPPISLECPPDSTSRAAPCARIRPIPCRFHSSAPAASPTNVSVKWHSALRPPDAPGPGLPPADLQKQSRPDSTTRAAPCARIRPPPCHPPPRFPTASQANVLLKIPPDSPRFSRTAPPRLGHRGVAASPRFRATPFRLRETGPYRLRLGPAAGPRFRATAARSPANHPLLRTEQKEPGFPDFAEPGIRPRAYGPRPIGSRGTTDSAGAQRRDMKFAERRGQGAKACSEGDFGADRVPAFRRVYGGRGRFPRAPFSFLRPHGDGAWEGV